MKVRSRLIQQCGLCAQWTHDGDHIPSGNRDPETGITPMDNVVCWRCERACARSVYTYGNASREVARGASALDGTGVSGAVIDIVEWRCRVSQSLRKAV